MPITPKTTAAPAASSTAIGNDPDVVLTLVLGKVKTNLRDRLLELASDAMKAPREGLHDDRRYLVAAAIESAIEDLNLEARRLRGRRLVRQLVLTEVGELCEELIELEVVRHHGESGIKYARLIRRLLHGHLVREQIRDAALSHRMEQAGADPSDPEPYVAPPVPPMPNDPIPSTLETS